MSAIPTCLVLAALGVLPGTASATPPAPLQIEQTNALYLPDDAPDQGMVRAVVLVDEQGRLLDLLVLGYTDRRLVGSALTTLRSARFEPARRPDGQPAGLRSVIECRFDAHGRVVTIRPDHTTMERFFRLPPRFEEVLGRAAELDAPLAVVTRGATPPAPPVVEPASVVVDFYVDAEGQPRMPVATRGADAPQAAAAVTAISSWRFQPPTRRGRPVAVRVQQEFVFSP